MTDNKGINSLWGYHLVDSKGRHDINDVKSNLENNFQKKNDDTLTTTSKTITGAINEVNSNIGDIAKQTITTEERTKLTSLDTDYQKKNDDTLTTTSKSITDAINEVNAQYKDIANKVTSKNNIDSGNYIHISFDDITYCMQNLINNTYTSLFKEPLFAWLKGLHDSYGAKFSLYVYNINSLSNIPATYKQEFFNNSDWLKFGLHSTTSNSTYEKSSSTDGATDWNTFITQVIRFTGSANSIDRIPRLNYFAGNKACLVAMRDCNCGALGFLSADDSRTPYFLDDAKKTYLQTHDSIIDLETGLIFYHTDMRGDWFLPSFSSTNTYDVPTKNNVYDELVYRYGLSKYADTFKSFIYFCHEWQFYEGTSLNEYKKWTEDACKFAHDYNIGFDYPQNRIGINLSSLQLGYNALLEKINNSSGGSGVRLATPTGLSISGITLTWNAVTNSTKYYIYDGNTLLGEATSETYNLSSLTTGTHTIYVQAIDDSGTYLNSLKASISYEQFKTVVYDDSNNGWTDSTAVKLYTSPTQMTFTKDCSLAGGIDYSGAGCPMNSIGRACCIDGVLTGMSDGQAFSLSSYALSNGSNITYSIWYGYVNNNIISSSQYISTDNNYTSRAWLSDSVVLPTDSSKIGDRFLAIAFKKGDGTTSFTDDELAELSSLIQIN